MSKYRLQASYPHKDVDLFVDADNAYRAADTLRMELDHRGFQMSLDVQEPDHCRGVILRDNGIEFLPVGTVAATAAE